LRLRFDWQAFLNWISTRRRWQDLQNKLPF
jgi:hypothetical protein